MRVPKSDLRGNFRLQDSTERGAHGDEHYDPENCREKARSNSAGIHKDVEIQDVHNYRGEDSKGQRNVSICQQQDSAKHLDEKYKDEIVGHCHRRHKLDGQRRSWRRLGNKVKKSVQSKD